MLAELNWVGYWISKIEDSRDKTYLLGSFPDCESVRIPHGNDAVRLIPLYKIQTLHVVTKASGDTLAKGFVQVNNVMELPFTGNINGDGNLVRGGRTCR